MRKWIGFVVLLLLLILPLRAVRGATDAVVDAKRKAAAQLLKDNKPADAITLYNEVIKADDTQYADHLQLARAHDKLNHSAESNLEYRKVLDLSNSSSTNVDERAARAEAERKTKLVAARDVVSGKLDSTVDEYLKKLEGLEREAIQTRNMPALARIFRYKGATWNATGHKDRGYLEVAPNIAWQKTSVEVRQGMVYHVRAAGTWNVYGANPAPSEMTALGTGKRDSFGYVAGSLVGQVNGKPFQLGEDASFTAPANGILELMEEELNQADRVRNKGSISVLIWQ